MRITKRQLHNFLSTKNFSKLIQDNEPLPAVSWLFVTHNRCPWADPEKNPLVLAFQTLLNNHFYQVNDFVVVDDFSNDYTKASIDWLSQRYAIKIRYIKNKRRLSCSGSRKVGLKYVQNNLVFMGDDDCLYSEYFLAGSILTYQLLTRQKPQEKIAVINFPVYEKRFYPQATIEQKQCGRVKLEQTFFYHEFDHFPAEYLEAPRYLDKSKTILRPFLVDTFKGVNLCDKRLILQSGNYVDLSMWPSSYSEHIELSYKLQQLGCSIYHQPDPRISCLHLKYGNLTRDKFDRRFERQQIAGLKYRLGTIIDWSQQKIVDTGARLADDSFYIAEVGSFFSFYLKISDRLGLKFARNQYELFVAKGLVFSTTPLTIIKSKQIRKKLFLIGIKEGIKATELQTGHNYQGIWQQIVNEIANK